MDMKLQIGPHVISSYRRLSYTAWHAFAEFVDNSTQAYFDHRSDLLPLLQEEKEPLTVSISYDRNDDLIRIADNSAGMSYERLQDALHVGKLPKNTSGRSEYGMGMKTAACWLGDLWTVRTKGWDDEHEYEVTVDVNEVAKGNMDLPIRSKKIDNPKQHYTIIEIRQSHRTFVGRTLGKIRDFLSSMYREDFRAGELKLTWCGTDLAWGELDDLMLKAPDESLYRKEFSFEVDDKIVVGWVGILGKGSRAKAGFSILHRGRVVRGWPDSWRPRSLYGQIQGSNDLINQRLVGEIHLDDFIVSHTKDDILWTGDEEETVETLLLTHCGDYRDVATKYRKNVDERGPSTIETDAAIEELKRELTSPEIVDVINLEVVPEPEVVREAMASLVDAEREREPRFGAQVAGIVVKGFITTDRSENDPYFVCDSTRQEEVCIVINQTHPHWTQLKGSDGVLNYLRHCTYDALAEHQARHRASTLDPDTVKLWKDKFLRIPFEIEMHEPSPVDRQQE